MDSKTLKGRMERCRRLMAERGFDVLLLTKPANMFYMTGDGRLCAFTMITGGGEVALGVPKTDVEDVANTAHYSHLTGFDDEVGMIHAIGHYFQEFGIEKGTVGLEYTYLTQSMFSMLTHPHAKPEDVAPRDCTAILSELRIIKDAEEIERIGQAARVADAGMEAAVRHVRPGVTESRIAAEAEYAMRQEGADGFWLSYISSGERTNIAHGLPTQRTIREGDLVMIDIHPIVNGYSADMCRTICAGRPTPEQEDAFSLYLRAQQKAIGMARAGMGVAELEQALHGVLRDAGQAEHIFGPPIHGVGIEFEESPLPPGHAFFHGEKAPEPLKANTVIAVGNCGLYTGPWGVRVEDTVVLTGRGPTVLTTYPRQLRQEA